MSAGKKQTNEFLSTHPSSSTRIKNITRVINEINSRNPKRITPTKEKSKSSLLGNKII